MKAERLDLLQPCRVSCLSEEDFAAEMESTVRPFLKRIRRFRLLPLKASKAASPQGTNVSGNDRARFLSCELYPNPDAKATIVICYGFCESCRKYDELVYYFYRQGYEVAILDHRGHGKSVREVDDPSVVHIGRFTRYVRDFHHFVEKAVKPAAAGKPLLLYAHSMGGCIGALYLEQYPTDFSAAVLSAPMLGLKLGLCPSWAARALCDFQVLCGRGKKRLFTQSAFDPQEPFSKSSASSFARFCYYREIRRKEPLCRTSCASYDWGREAINAGKFALSPSQTRKVQVPVLVFQAGLDSLVTPSSQKKFISRIANGRLVVVPGVRHEIYRAPNQVLAPYLEEIFRFFDKTAGALP